MNDLRECYCSGVRDFYKRFDDTGTFLVDGDTVRIVPATRKPYYIGHSRGVGNCWHNMEKSEPEYWDGLDELADEIHEINRSNGWNTLKPSDWPKAPGPVFFSDGWSTDSEKRERKRKAQRIGSCLALLHSEASEALEAVREDDFENFSEEMADVFIRTLDIAYGLGVDLEQAVADKLEKNRSRGYRHGGRAI